MIAPGQYYITLAIGKPINIEVLDCYLDTKSVLVRYLDEEGTLLDTVLSLSLFQRLLPGTNNPGLAVDDAD